MFSENRKRLLFAAWALVVCVVAIVMGVTSVPYWMVVACVAIVPPVVARRLWHSPDETTSESINASWRA